MISRNTKLYKISYLNKQEKVEVLYRDLTTLELSYLYNIKNDITRYDMAAKVSICNCDPSIVPLGHRIKIGEEVLNKGLELTNDIQLLEISVSEFRESIKTDDVLMCLKHILSVLPGQSFTDLLKLNFKDLIELTCLCEEISGKPIFTFGGKRGTTLINPKNLPDDGKSLQQKMDELNSHVGVHR